jgi:hypothetical protein
MVQGYPLVLPTQLFIHPLLALATLDGKAQVEIILFVSLCPR